MLEVSPDLKTVADIGLGAISLLLWFRQSKLWQTQVKTTQDLTTMVKDHEDRIKSLEHASVNTLAARVRKRSRR